MRKLHKGLIIGGATLAVLVPAGLVAADQIDMGNGHGRGNGTMSHDCTRTGNATQDGNQMQRRDGTGPNHATNSVNTPGTTTGNTATGAQRGPMNGTGRQTRSGA
jgi:hypothetical protein